MIVLATALFHGRCVMMMMAAWHTLGQASIKPLVSMALCVPGLHGDASLMGWAEFRATAVR